MTMLLRHLLVVDEVHASDTYMTKLLETVIRLHLEAGGHALLMSATLGCETRERLLSLGKPFQIPNLTDASQIPFPCIMAKSTEGTTHVVPVSSPEVGKSIEVQLFPISGSPSSVARQAFVFARQGGRVLVLRNTVADCIKTQIALEEIAEKENGLSLLFRYQGTLAVHHSRFSKEDRESLDGALEERFGFGSSGEPVILVATQTVQQSLDLDFDVILSDLCPMDVLLQRVGRVHRHPRSNRAAPFQTAILGVLTPENRDLGQFIWKTGETRGPNGIGTVYSDLRILEATWRALERFKRLGIPAMNRALVEQTTHPDVLSEIIKELGGHWKAHDSHAKGVQAAHQGIAVNHRLSWRVRFGDPDSLFPADELDGKVKTRLGAGERLIRFSPPFTSPFGSPVKILPLPAFMVRNAEADAEPQNIVTAPTGTMFSFGSARYRYDRLGLRVIDTGPDQKESEEDSDA
jgi:CRISPR-associated endonuclease/helicase Cas3